ncbi:MAG: cupin domain-containing protein [Chloroflexi bacterium]|nr:cupin domain-containing protein [Chloroflexota bacterium]
MSGTTPPTRYLELEAIHWEEIVPGARAHLLWEGAGGWPRIALVRLEPGTVVPRHRHTALERVVVIEGSVEDEYGECRPGGTAGRPVGCTHSLHTSERVLMVAVADGPIEFDDVDG